MSPSGQPSWQLVPFLAFQQIKDWIAHHVDNPWFPFDSQTFHFRLISWSNRFATENKHHSGWFNSCWALISSGGEWANLIKNRLSRQPTLPLFDVDWTATLFNSRFKTHSFANYNHNHRSWVRLPLGFSDSSSAVGSPIHPSIHSVPIRDNDTAIHRLACK